MNMFASVNNLPDSTTRTMLEIGYGTHSWTIDITGCEDMHAGFEFLLRDWQVHICAATDPREADFTFRKHEEGYDWRIRGSKRRPDDLFGKPASVVKALFDFQYTFIDWVVDALPELSVIHCGSVQMGGRLVLFPGNPKAGKSLMTAALATRGHRVFSDDVLAFNIKSGEAVALGLPMRLRLPIPPQATSEALRKQILSHDNIADEDQMFIHPGDRCLARRQTTARVASIVMLKRMNGKARAQMSPSTTGKALKSLLEQNYSTSLLASQLFDGLAGICDGAQCLQLEYSSVDEAIACLETAFANDPAAPPAIGG